MPEIGSPFEEPPRKISPGELAIQWASLVEMGFRWFGVSLYQHEFQALATVIGALFRAYPKLKDLGKPDEMG